MQDFIKQSLAHKRHQCCAILDHINIFQSRIIFQQRDKTKKNMISGYQHKILNHPRRGVGVCISTWASRWLESKARFWQYISGVTSTDIRGNLCVCVLQWQGGLAWFLTAQSWVFLHSHWNHWGNMMGVFSLAESSKGDMSSTWINK